MIDDFFLFFLKRDDEKKTGPAIKCCREFFHFELGRQLIER